MGKSVNWLTAIENKIDTIIGKDLFSVGGSLKGNITLALDSILDNIRNVSKTYEDGVELIAKMNTSIQWLMDVFQKYHLKYGVYIIVILVALLVFNEALKLIVSACLCLGSEYQTCQEFLNFRRTARARLSDSSSFRMQNSTAVRLHNPLLRQPHEIRTID